MRKAKTVWLPTALLRAGIQEGPPGPFAQTHTCSPVVSSWSRDGAVGLGQTRSGPSSGPLVTWGPGATGRRQLGLASPHHLPLHTPSFPIPFAKNIFLTPVPGWTGISKTILVLAPGPAPTPTPQSVHECTCVCVCDGSSQECACVRVCAHVCACWEEGRSGWVFL